VLSLLPVYFAMARLMPVSFVDVIRVSGDLVVRRALVVRTRGVYLTLRELTLSVHRSILWVEHAGSLVQKADGACPIRAFWKSLAACATCWVIVCLLCAMGTSFRIWRVFRVFKATKKPTWYRT
jgi:hypothetical protein